MANRRHSFSRRVRFPFRRPLNLESLESRVLLSCNLDGFADALVQNLTRIQAPLNQLANTANDVPLIENQLKNLPELQLFTSNRLQPIITQMAGVDPLNQSAVQLALYNALGPSGLKMFSNQSQLTVATNASTCTIDVGMNFNYAAANVHLPANASFGIGLDALPISIATKGGVDIGLNYTQTATFQFTESAVQFTAGSIMLHANASLTPNTSFEAVVGFIPVTITNGGTPSQPTGLTADYTATDILTTPTTHFVGSASVYLHAAARVAGGTGMTFPGISTDLELHWSLDTNNPALNPPTFAFKNVTLELGTALSDLIRPVVDTVQIATIPIQPAIEILRFPLPGLTELSHAADGPDITLQELVDVAQQTGAFGAYGPLVQLISTMIDITNIINQIQSGPDLKINFGTFDLGGNGDLRTLAPALGLSLDGGDLTSLNPNGVGGSFDIGAVVQGVSNQLADIANDPSNDPLLRSSALAAQQMVQSYGNGVELTFPLIDNPMGCVFRLLLGQDVNLVQFKAQFIGDASKEDGIHFGPVEVGYAGQMHIDGLFQLAYDTYGLRKFLFEPAHDATALLDGFHFDDLTHLTLSGSLQAGVTFQPIPLLEVGGGGAISIDGDDYFGFSLVDPTPADGKLRFSEIDPQCLFTTRGQLIGSLNVFYRLGYELDLGLSSIFIGIKDSKELASATLLDLSAGCIGVAPDVPELRLAGDPATGQPQVDAEGNLTLFMGPHAELRTGAPFFTVDGDEVFQVEHVSGFPVPDGETVRVRYSGIEEEYSGVKRIIAYGGEGNDLIEIAPEVLTPVELHGGHGNDRLTNAGSGAAMLFGDAGDDILTSGTADDMLDGGPDNDYLVAGAGNDRLDGEDGDDTLIAGAGDDLMFGQNGVDQLDGGDGNDQLFGGAGNDRLLAGEGNNLIMGDAGDDAILSLGGIDIIHGGLDNDEIVAGAGDDQIFGDEGDDVITGQAGIDIIEGNDGHDVIFGEAGNDIIRGGAGDDQMSGGNDNDRLEGNSGNDIAYGDEGDDNLLGNDGNDQLDGGDGNDVLIGHDGDDTIDAGAGDDIVLGDVGTVGAAVVVISGIGRDTVYGRDGNDLIYGQGGDDFLDGGDGQDTILGQDGNDTILAGAGADYVAAGMGNDTVDGGADDDLIDGGSGQDVLSGGAGADRIYGRDGDDQLFGHGAASGPDDNAADRLYGEAGNDTADGGGGDDLLDGGAGVDVLYGGSGNDSIFAGAGIGDQLYGQDGDDRLEGSDDGADVDPNFDDTVRFGDLLDAGNGDDTILGYGGADLILAGAGDDWVNSGFGSDRIWGGAGNDYLYAGRGTGELIDGEDGNDVIYGSNEGNDTLRGGPGRDEVYGQGGSDTLYGDGDDDHLDAGSGSDLVFGGTGNDTLYGGGGVGDTLYGEAGDDVIHGSDDGADQLLGGDGRDTLYGHGGNDTLLGGIGDDILEGGAGDDIMSGEAGSDLMIGGADHDTLYGHNVSASGDDNSVDYLYGDFGTNGNEVGSGRDRLFGQGGNDLIWGEGDDDFIDVGAGTSNLFYYGAGDGAVPSNFVPPTPTPAPTVQPGVGITLAGATLPAGSASPGRWSELADSGSGDGLSISPAAGVEISIAVDAVGTRYAAWSDARNGNYEIYVARYVAGTGWQSVSATAQSAAEGGVSNTQGSSRRPSMAIDLDGNPLVAWTEFSNTTSDIRVAKFDPAAAGGQGAWVAIGSSLAAGGISSTGKADSAVLLPHSAGATVAWLDASSGNANVFVKRFNGTAWVGLGGAPSSSGTGVSLSTSSVTQLSATTDGAKVSVAWTQPVAGGSQIYLKEFVSTTWNALGGSASGGGLSNLAGTNQAPSIAYHAGTLFAAWQGDVQARPEIYVRQLVGSVWQQAGGNADIGVSQTKGLASQPRLASRGGQLHLVWIDDAQANNTGSTQTILASRWNGSSFLPQVSADTRAPGISATNAVDSLTLAVDATGKPLVGWTGPGQSSPSSQVFLRHNTFSATNTFTANATTSVQAILDANNLNPGDLIEVTANVSGFNVAADDAGVTIVGVPGVLINGPITLTATDDVTLQGLTVQGIVTINGGSHDSIIDSQVDGVTLNGGSDLQVIGNTITCDGVSLSGTVRPLLDHNAISVSPVGIAFATSTSTDVNVRRNTVAGGTSGIIISVATAGTIADNDITAIGTGIELQAAFMGAIQQNEIRDAAVGVCYAAAAALDANLIHHNATGVLASVSSTSTGFGFVQLPDALDARSNQIFRNTVGVQLSGGVMQHQIVRDNQTGVTGAGSLSASDFAHASTIEANTIGVDLNGPVQFNRIGDNVAGIRAQSNQLIAHNELYRNSSNAVLVSARTSVRVVSNTMYAPGGDNVRIEGGSREVEVTNNVLWAEIGYDLFVGNDSQVGFQSDYNILHVGSGGTIVHWSNYNFTDILDWQADVGLFDLHSRGSTVVNPGWSQPRFADQALNDLQMVALSAQQRFSSPQTDAGDPLSDLAASTSVVANQLANGSFESGLTGWTTNPEATIGTGSPTALDGTQYFRPGVAGAGFAEQSINLLTAGFTAGQLDSQDYVAVFGGRLRVAAETPHDTGLVKLRFFNGSGGLISEVVATAKNVSDRWELVGDRIQLPVGTRSVTYRFEGTRSTGSGSNDALLDNAFLRVHSDQIASDVGAQGNTALDGPAGASTASLPAPHVALRFPDVYTDWERDVPHSIRWESYGNTAELPVKIDLYQNAADGPVFVTTIAAATTDDGEFTWTPSSSGVNFAAYNLRIQLQLVGEDIVVDRSTESFSVPENTTTFFVNDRVAANDQYTSAVGGNRNTGKLASAPKPYPNNILRTYALGPSHTLSVDTGDYRLFQSLRIANAAGLGDDEGFSLTGPTSAGSSATLRHANPLFTTAPIVELYDADFVTMSRLVTEGGTYGVWLHGGTDNFHGSHLTIGGASLDGLNFDSTVAGSTLDFITATANNGHGIYVNGPIDRIADSDLGYNQGSGIELWNSTTVQIEGNQVHDNRSRGIRVVHGTPTIGSSNLAAARGNIVRNNTLAGIEAGAGALIVGNTVSGHTARNTAGIYSSGGTVRNNVVFGNYDGIAGGALAIGNNIYENLNVGLFSYTQGARENVVHGNCTAVPVNGQQITCYGMQVAGGTLQNNLVYDNQHDPNNRPGGIRVVYSQNAPQLINNTVYEPLGNAVTVDNAGTTWSLQLRNNILSTGGGYALYVPSGSQIGFQSDYNLLQATGSGRIGYWQGADQPTLSAWQTASLQDQNSLSQDPRFVSPATGDFHEQSLNGSYHGGLLAPILNVATGLPIFPSATVTIDTAQSPVIDRGSATDAFANEPSPNGNFINLGAYGNTAQASLSPAQYVTVTRPDGGETWPAAQSFAIRWRSHDMAGNVKIELLNNVGAVVDTIAASTPNSGVFNWSIPAVFPPGNYAVRVTRLDAGMQADVSNSLFNILAPVTVYYVNDGTVAVGDWTTAPGNDTNNGLSPSAPKASLQAVLNAYDLGPGDTIRIDAGTYNTTTNILLAADDSGVTIEGYHDVAFPSRQAVINRGNASGGSYAIQFMGADDVTLDHLLVTGAEWGIVALAGVDSDRIHITASEIFGHTTGGIYFETSNESQQITGNQVYNAGLYGIRLPATAGATINNNTVHDIPFGTGIDLRGAASQTAMNVVSGNHVYAVGTGIFSSSSAVNAPVTISGNDVHNSRNYGIQNTNVNVLITGNTVHHNLAVGIGGTNVVGNEVFENGTGVDVGGSGFASGNRAYHNTIGFVGSGTSTVAGNSIFSNQSGVESTSGALVVKNNLVYDNSAYGVKLRFASGTRIENNTINQGNTGSGVHLESQSANVSVRNNIFSVAGGYAIDVVQDSQVGFASDYNTLFTIGSGKLGLWGSHQFTDRADWTFELGFDQHSQTTDPLLVDPAGPDGTPGFGTAALGPVQYLDENNAVLTGTWTTRTTAGYAGDYADSNAAGATATWSLSGLVPGHYYQIAATWPAVGSNTTRATIRDGASVLWSDTLDQRFAPTDFADQGVMWKRFGTFSVNSTQLQVTFTKGSSLAVADALRLVEVAGASTALDDDFSVSTLSSTIDAGDPSFEFTSEPSPGGDRINLGHTGNTGAAATSAAQFVQVLSPNGLEKTEWNQQLPITWRTYGINDPAGIYSDAVLGNAPAAYYRLGEKSGTTAVDSTGQGRTGTYAGTLTLNQIGAMPAETNSSVLFSAGNVTIADHPSLRPAQLTVEAWVNPDNAASSLNTVLMKSSSGSWNDGYGLSRTGIGDQMRFFVNNFNGAGKVDANVPKNQWSHVVGTYDGSGLKIYVNGILAGTTVYSTPITHSVQPMVVGAGAGGFSWRGKLDEVAVYPAALTATQIAQHYSRGTRPVYGTVDIQLVESSTLQLVAVIAQAVSNTGTFNWTIPGSLPEGSYRIQLNANQGILPGDVSDAPFLVANDGQQFYVNDLSTASDVFTTSTGNNANSGKSPAAPLASLSALLAAYDLEPGDVVHVDAGAYALYKNVVLGSQDSGVRIEGPGAVGSTATATLDRGNAAIGSYAIQFAGGDDVTIDHLSLIGAEYGVYAPFQADSDRISVTHSSIYGHTQRGIELNSTNDQPYLADNQVYDNSQGGIHVFNGVGATIIGNRVYSTSAVSTAAFATGIRLTGQAAPESLIEDNEVFTQGTGINVSSSIHTIVRGNNIHDIRDVGITVVGNIEVVGNTTYRVRNGNGVGSQSPLGILVSNGAIARDNVSYANKRGLEAAGAFAYDNRIYNNELVGLVANSNSILGGNRVYSNANVGVLGYIFSGQLANNLIYDNANDGIWLWNSTGARIENNTIYQPVSGDAIQLAGLHPEFFLSSGLTVSNLNLRNNIFSVAQGFAVNVAADSEIGFASDYNDYHLTGSAKPVRWEDREFTTAAEWYLESGYDAHSISADPQFVDIDGADNVLGYQVATSTDFGQDDDFRVLAGSKTIDAGDPSRAITLEPLPNGGRINLGHTGNALSATSSLFQRVQILSPNGLEKIEAGQPVAIDWLSSGLTFSSPVALIDAGGIGAGVWSENRYQTGSATPITTTNTIDLTGVTNAAPPSVYQTQANSGFSAASPLAYHIPAPDGQYTLRLHFVEYTFPIGQRLMDIRLQGSTVATGYDIRAAAGGLNKATTLSFNTTATGDQGILLELFTPNGGQGATLAALELAAANAFGVAAPTVNLQLSTNNGTSWTTIASNLAMDVYGRGSYNWTPTTETSGNTARVRVVANNGSLPTDSSDASFLITNGGTDYYVNDGSSSSDVVTTALGDNLASGKRPDQPVASLQTLLTAYDLDLGDVVHVDAGTYRVYRNLQLLTQDSGVRIEGPNVAGAVALLNRGNTNAGSYVVDLAGADDVVIDRLALTGANYGVNAGNAADSHRVTLSHNDIFGHAGGPAGNLTAYGIYVDSGNEDLLIYGNRVHNISGNTTSTSGIYSKAMRTVIRENDVYGNPYGINVDPTGSLLPSDQIVVAHNIVHDNVTLGIDAWNNVLVSGNLVYGQLGASAIGINARSATVMDNIVHDNATGIFADLSVIAHNRAYRNTRGITASNTSTIDGNHVYSNSIGISGDALSGFQGLIANNVVYANTNHGIFIERSVAAGGRIANNTVYQSVGDTIRLENVTQGMVIRNNVLWTDAGHDIFVANNSSPTNIVSDYNLLQTGPDPNAHVGYWGGVDRHTLADWRNASGQDVLSVAGDPLFVDRNGSDNVLGFSVSDGYDGGLDDNFHLKGGSPAIDHGDGIRSTDREGNPPTDDPGSMNNGSMDYFEQASPTLFQLSGTAQNWRGDDNGYSWNLPFAFPWYGTNYTTAFVSTNGFLQFGTSTGSGSPANSTVNLLQQPRIAALWDDLTTAGAGDDIYLNTSVPGQATVRWNATNKADGSDANFAITLFSDGRTLLTYGAGNTNLTPTVGVSQGNNLNLTLLTYNGQAMLTNAASRELFVAPGIVDLGAHEFLGSSLDVSPPTILSSIIETEPGHPVTTRARVVFSEPIDPIDALSPMNYELRSAGANGLFGDSDDTVYGLIPDYTAGDTVVTISVNVAGGVLPPGNYRFRVSGDTSIHDLAGNRLDGNLDGQPGGDFLGTNAKPVLPAISNRTVDEGQLLTIAAAAADANVGDVLTYSLAAGAPSGATIDPATGVFTWTPSESDGPGVFDVSVLVTDNGSPSLTDLRTFTVTVNEVNTAPSINPISNQSIDTGNLLSFVVTATDPDLPANNLTFGLINAPAGASIHPTTGLFTWTPGQSQGPATYEITLFVADNGTPIRVTSLSFMVTVQALVDGDFNDDGLYNLIDVDGLVAAIASHGNNPAFDLTGDGLVNVADRDAWLAEAGSVNLPSGNAYLLGDANLDGVVDGQDFIRWNSHKFTSTAKWSDGDFNADGVVDGQDFILWNTNKFEAS